MPIPGECRRSAGDPVRPAVPLVGPVGSTTSAGLVAAETTGAGVDIVDLDSYHPAPAYTEISAG
ncbi:hypothetical protein [Gordonia aurantiaca]|uniref:hypothetical protein n=1 Tax=Gordonia sp. B21 TaxID=3151852 RepID=UPI00326696D4